MRQHEKGAVRNFLSMTGSMKPRLILYFLLIVLLPILIISISTYTISQYIIEENSKTTMENSLHVIKASILSELNSIDELATAIYTNPEMIDLLSNTKSVNKADIATEMATLDRLLDGLHTGYGTQDAILPSIYMFDRPEYVQYNFSDKVFDISRIEKEDWYKSLPSRAHFTVVGYQDRNDTIRIAKRLFALKNAEVDFTAILTIDIPATRFRAILYELNPLPEGEVHILDGQGGILISTNGTLEGSDVSALGLNIPEAASGADDAASKVAGRHLVSMRRFPAIGWSMIAVAPLEVLNRPLQQFGQVLLIVIAICLVVGVIIALALAESFAKPIRNIVQSMDTVKGGNFDVSLEYPRKDEFRTLTDSYQQMLVDLRQMIDRLYVSEANKRTAELKALQAQINPHFLYNTLDSINWLAIKSSAPDISLMVTSLSDFFRYSVSQQHDLIPLADEMHQLESYLTIQKVRFSQKLDYSIHFPPELGDLLIIKMLLQPIVENSVLHGVETRSGEEKGTVLVSAERQGDNLVVTIADDGQGADIEALNQMLDNQDSERMHGAQNVHNRILYFFGEGYGMRYEPNYMGGVTAKLTIPAVHKTEWKEGMNYDTHGDC